MSTTLPKADWQWITPEVAAQWIAATKHAFRAPSKDRIRAYADDILAGRWDSETCAPIVLGSNGGPVHDGLHRLSAVVLAGKKIRSLVCIGAKHSVATDTHRPRSLSDELAYDGHKNVNKLAAAVRWLWIHEHDWQIKGISSGCPATKAQLWELFQANKNIVPSVSKAGSTCEDVGSHGLFAVLHYLESANDSERANWFLDRISDGVDLSDADPIRKLRERLAADRMNHKTRLTRLERTALVLVAWNAYIEERPCQVLRWSACGRNAVPFPKPVF